MNRTLFPVSWLRLAQDAFLLWVLLGALWGYFSPEAARAGAQWIPQALAAVMLGMGLTLTGEDLRGLGSSGRPLLLGIALQYVAMPLSAWVIASAMGLPKLLALGVILVGASPGGTASNAVTFLARGDVALSIGMTTASTLLSPLLTPLWLWLLASAWLRIDPIPLFWTVTQIVLLPVLIGVVGRRLWTPRGWFLKGLLPVFSMGVIAWIVGVIVGLNHTRLDSSSLPLIAAAVVVHNAVGLALGYAGGRRGGFSARCSRTLSIEVGMQNSGLAVALAIVHFGPEAALPGAVFSIWHNITGPLLAAIWRRSANGAALRTRTS